MRGTLLPIFFYDKSNVLLLVSSTLSSLFVARDDVKWRDSQPSEARGSASLKICKYLLSHSPNHACTIERQKGSNMVVGAGSLRFFGVLWMVLLHQTTASGRIL